MHATRKALAERLPEIDVVVELLDARLPGSSASPLLAELTAGKPALKLLNKADLADPERTALWLAHYQAQPGTQALAFEALRRDPVSALRRDPGPALQRGTAGALQAACRALVPGRGGMAKPLRVLVCGVPNVGKSSLINGLLGKRAAATGDEAGITKTEQRLQLASDFYLYDTPGVLWPRISVVQSGLFLAAAGSVGRNAYDEQEVALALLAAVREPYGTALAARYKLPGLGALSDEALLGEIGRRRGGLRPGGVVDLHKAAEAALGDFRSGAWGRITLETPAQFAQWWAEGQLREAERAQRKAAREAGGQRRGAAPATG
jgi:ribosome biogenesis GTPase A